MQLRTCPCPTPLYKTGVILNKASSSTSSLHLPLYILQVLHHGRTKSRIFVCTTLELSQAFLSRPLARTKYSYIKCSVCPEAHMNGQLLQVTNIQHRKQLCTS